ncbi:MAG: C40 family peptidase [Pseudomonadota bacterium]
MTCLRAAHAHVHAPTTWLFEQPDATSQTSSQLLYGERLVVRETQGDWVNVTAARDGYSGWLRGQDVSASSAPPITSCNISVPLALIYAQPDFHYAPLAGLPMHAQVSLAPESASTGFDQDAQNAAFVKLSDGYFVSQKHISTGPFASDPVDVAKFFLGAPYAWGGRTINGIDCSGLVQMSLWACGIDCPRDSSDQFTQLGRTLEPGETPRQGDLVFFPGHVGWYLAGGKLLHANATHMRCTIDPLDDVLNWVARDHKAPLRGFKRL